MTARLRPSIVTVALPLAMLSATVLSSSICARSWSKYTTSRFVPCLTLPAVGASWPSRSLMSVVLPAPLGPRMPIFSPRRMTAEKSRMTGGPPAHA